MEEIRRAPLRVRERHGEPASWLFRRLAVRNGYHEPREFAAAFGVDFEALARGDGAAGVAVVSGLPADAVEGWTPVPAGKNAISLRGQSLRYPFDWDGGIGGPATKACPRCIRADLRDGSGPRAFRPYVRAWWCLRDVHTCAVHSCFLVKAETPQVGPESPPFWRAFERIESERVPDRDAEADRYVLGRLGVMPGRAIPVLDGLPLGEASAILSWLGELANGTEPTDVRSMPPGEAARFRSEGLELAKEWPGRIHGRLRDILRGAAEGVRGFKGIYGRFYSRLYDDRFNRDSHAGRELLKAVFQEHALETYPFGPTETLFRKPPSGNHRVNLTHAADICGLGKTALVELVEAFGLKPATPDGIQKEGLKKTDVEALRDAYRGSLPADEAAARLGIEKSELADLKRFGMVSAQFDEGSAPFDRYGISDLDSLSRSIAEAVGCDDVGKAMAHVRAVATERGTPFAQTVARLLGRQTRAMGQTSAVPVGGQPAPSVERSTASATGA